MRSYRVYIISGLGDASRDDVETLSAWLPQYVRVSSSYKRQAIWRRCFCFVIRLNKLQNKQSNNQWYEIPWCWCAVTLMQYRMDGLWYVSAEETLKMHLLTWETMNLVLRYATRFYVLLNDGLTHVCSYGCSSCNLDHFKLLSGQFVAQTNCIMESYIDK